MFIGEGLSKPHTLVVPDSGYPGHCPGKISGQLWLLLMKTCSGSTAHVAYPSNLAALKPPIVPHVHNCVAHMRVYACLLLWTNRQLSNQQILEG